MSVPLGVRRDSDGPIRKVTNSSGPTRLGSCPASSSCRERQIKSLKQCGMNKYRLWIVLKAFVTFIKTYLL
jgi:hypothetical protein